MTDEQAFYGLMLRELDGWSVRSIVHVGIRWEVVIAKQRSRRAIEVAAADHPGLAMRSAWTRVELRVGRDE
jgi:hypothetical protein